MDSWDNKLFDICAKGVEVDATIARVNKVSGVFSVTINPDPEAIVVMCNDPHFQTTFRDFLEERLDLPVGKYVPILADGGPGMIAHPDQLPGDFRFLIGRVTANQEIYPTVSRLILIGHQECTYYRGLSVKVPSLRTTFGRKVEHWAKSDLFAIASDFKHKGLRLVPQVCQFLEKCGLTIELYYSRLVDESGVEAIFERIPIAS